MQALMVERSGESPLTLLPPARDGRSFSLPLAGRPGRFLIQAGAGQGTGAVVISERVRGGEGADS